jgi:hypothetical protein
MSDYQFDDIAPLQRNRTIEGETGTELGLPGGFVLIVLAASDANPRWRNRSEEITNELNRLRNARANNERVRKYLSRIYAETLVLDWPVGPKSKGVPVPFSVEACAAFLNQADDAYAAIDAVVYDTKNYRGQRIEAVVGEVKNS